MHHGDRIPMGSQVSDLGRQTTILLVYTYLTTVWVGVDDVKLYYT